VKHKEIIEDIKRTIPEWAEKTLQEYGSLYSKIIRLTMEVDRLNACMESSYEIDQQYGDWVHEFLEKNDLGNLCKDFDSFITNKSDELEEEIEENK
jgi:hypothetical protein